MATSASSKPPLSDLTPQMRNMFQPRPPLEFKKPVGRRVFKPEKEQTPAQKQYACTGLAGYLSVFEKEAPPPVEPFELPAEKKKRVREQLAQLQKEKNDLLAADWNPQNDANEHKTENAYHTLFVGRLSYDTTNNKLRREFEQYGSIKYIRMVTKKDDGTPRGYAFIEFDKEEAMAAAYKKSDGKKLDGRKILVDVERGRTVKNWRPMRLGGGLGGRKAMKSKKQLEEERKALPGGGVYGGASSISSYVGGDRGRSGGGGDRGGDRPRSRSRDRYSGGGGGGSSSSSYGGGGSRGGDRGSDRDRDRDSSRGFGGSAPTVYGPGGGMLCLSPSLQLHDTITFSLRSHPLLFMSFITSEMTHPHTYLLKQTISFIYSSYSGFPKQTTLLILLHILILILLSKINPRHLSPPGGGDSRSRDDRGGLGYRR